MNEAFDFINEFSSIVFPSSIISPIFGKSDKDSIFSKNGWILIDISEILCLFEEAIIIF